MLLHVPEVLTRAELERVRQLIEPGPWEDGRVSVGAQGAQAKHNRQLKPDAPNARQAVAIISAALNRHPVFFAAALPLKIAPLMFNRYEGGETYGLHVDSALRHEPAGWLRTDVSSTLFLSDPESYAGGELEAVDTYGTHEAKLPAGDLVLYPSSSLHQVHPVTRGVRLACILWLQSMVREPERRRQLYELDQIIQRLRGQLGDGGDVLALTNHYHNLLRQWSEV